jgi:hypothetical protein
MRNWTGLWKTGTQVNEISPTVAKATKTPKVNNMATKMNNGITTAKMGKVRTAAPSKDGIAAKGKTKGKQIVMKGGKPLGMCGGGMAKKK